MSYLSRDRRWPLSNILCKVTSSNLAIIEEPARRLADSFVLFQVCNGIESGFKRLVPAVCQWLGTRMALHLESWPPGINVYIHVWTMSVSCCTMLCDSSWQTWFRHVYKIINMYIHVCTLLQMYIHVYTWYVHVCTYCSTNMYVHRSDVYVHIYTIMYMFWII